MPRLSPSDKAVIYKKGVEAVKYLLLLLFAACTPEAEIGHIYSKYGWDCVKTGYSSGLGLSMKGSVVASGHTYCQVSKCFLFTKKRQKWIDELISKELVEDKLCIN